MTSASRLARTASVFQQVALGAALFAGCTQPPPAAPPAAQPQAEAPTADAPVPALAVHILDEDGRLSIAMTRVADGVWAMRDVTGRAFGALQAARDKVVVQDAEGNVVAAVRDGERGLGVYDGRGEVLALLKDAPSAVRVLGADGSTLALVEPARVVVDDAAVKTTVQVTGVAQPVVAAGVLTLTQLDITARMALLGWFALRPTA